MFKNTEAVDLRSAPDVENRKLKKSVSEEPPAVSISNDFSEVRYSKEINTFQSFPIENQFETQIQTRRTGTSRVLSHIRSISEGSINLASLKIPNVDVQKARKILIKEVVSKAISVRDGAREKLQKRGLLKSNRVFGSNIPSIVKVDGEKIPKFLLKCISKIADKPEYMRSEGLYRRNGNMAAIQSLRFEVDQGRLIKLDMVSDVHILTGLVKLFFRELSSPLIPWDTMKALIDAFERNEKRKENEKWLRTVGQFISTMHQANRDTLLYVLEHLHAVKELSEINQMNVENLAMMLGPTMSWTQDLANLTNMTTNLIKQNNVVGCLINEIQQLKMINK